MSTARLLAGGRRGNSLDGVLENVAQLQSLHKITANRDASAGRFICKSVSTDEFQIMLRSLMPTLPKFL